MEKSIRSFGDEIVIDGVDFLRVIWKVKDIQFRFVLDDLPHFIFEQFSNLNPPWFLVIFAALYNNNGFVAINHTHHKGSLNPQKDIITCYYFGIDLCIGNSFYSLYRIRFQLVDESYYT